MINSIYKLLINKYALPAEIIVTMLILLGENQTLELKFDPVNLLSHNLKIFAF